MFHREALPASTLDLLIQICSAPKYSAFGLAGGTALALRLGHRVSIDLDFFSSESFDASELAASLGSSYPLTVTNLSTNSLSSFVKGVKVDFVTYRYPLLQPVEMISGVRLFSLDDITAMKLAALINRGAKKDFYDLDSLISNLGLPSILSIYGRKFPAHDSMIALRSLIYFEDAESDPDPESLAGRSWEEVKSGISAAVRALL